MSKQGYLIDASFHDTVLGVDFTRVYKKKGAFCKTVMSTRYCLLNAVEFPSCVVIKHDNFVKWRDTPYKRIS